MSELQMAILVVAGVFCGLLNAVAGGGSFITLPTMLALGFDAKTANISSSLAMFPGQVSAAWTNRHALEPIGPLPMRQLLAWGMIGSAIGGLLLLATPAAHFHAMLPWLVLLSTGLFAWGRWRRQLTGHFMGKERFTGLHVFISAYGGYFGGGLGFLLLALFSMAGAPVRSSQVAKNIVGTLIRLASILVFALSGWVDWQATGLLSLGALVGGWIGGKSIQKLPESVSAALVITIGLTLFGYLIRNG